MYLTREEYLKILMEQGYVKLREDFFLKDNQIFLLEETCHFIEDGVRQCTYELKYTGEHKCCLFCRYSYYKDLGVEDEDVIICGLTNEYIGYPCDDAKISCCEKWAY